MVRSVCIADCEYARSPLRFEGEEKPGSRVGQMIVRAAARVECENVRECVVQVIARGIARQLSTPYFAAPSPTTRPTRRTASEGNPATRETGQSRLFAARLILHRRRIRADPAEDFQGQ